jgi:hypothetical protein
VKGLFSYANIKTLFGLDLLFENIKMPIPDNFALHSQIKFFFIEPDNKREKQERITINRKIERSAESKINTKKNTSNRTYPAFKSIDYSKINWWLRKKNYFYNLQIRCYKENSTS